MCVCVLIQNYCANVNRFMTFTFHTTHIRHTYIHIVHIHIHRHTSITINTTQLNFIFLFFYVFYVRCCNLFLCQAKSLVYHLNELHECIVISVLNHRMNFVCRLSSLTFFPFFFFCMTNTYKYSYINSFMCTRTVCHIHKKNILIDNLYGINNNKNNNIKMKKKQKQ